MKKMKIFGMGKKASGKPKHDPDVQRRMHMVDRVADDEANPYASGASGHQAVAGPGPSAPHSVMQQDYVKERLQRSDAGLTGEVYQRRAGAASEADQSGLLDNYQSVHAD